MADPSPLPTDPGALLEMASRAATAAIQQQNERIAHLTTELEKAKEQLERLKQLAALGKPGRLSEPDLFSPVSVAVGRFTSAALAARAAEDKRQTQAVADINLTLAATRSPMKVGELQAAIKKELGREWGESTLYAHLAKGRDSGLYHHVNNTWSITDKGMEATF